MYCLRYWARYVRKGEVKSGGIKIENESVSWILLLDSPFREIPFGPIHSSETPCHTCWAVVYPGGDKETSQRRSASVTNFSQPRAWISLKRASAAPQSKLCCVNLLKESECRASVQIVLCNSFLYTNNIQKYYSVSRCVISIIIVIAPT